MAPAIDPVDLDSPGFLYLVPLIGGVLALLLTLTLVKKVRSAESFDPKTPHGPVMEKLAKAIQSGAKDFLRTEYKYLAIFVVVFAIILFVLFTVQDEDAVVGLRYAGCFLGGAILSASAGWGGMIIATDANIRTTNAAEKNGLNAALQVAFAGGSVMGFTVVGLGILGVTIFALLMDLGLDDKLTQFQRYQQTLTYLTGFGFGASAIALFARVAGGIYTKAADVGADLVGKVESGMEEDSAQNPAVIADNVGDNVGDVAGMGADLFESYVGSIIAAGTLATSTAEVAYPFWISGFGILAAAIGSKCVSIKDSKVDESTMTNEQKTEANLKRQKELLHSLSMGTFIACFFSVALTALTTWLLFEDSTRGWNLFGCMIIGLAAGVLIGEATEICTSYAYAPVKSISAAGETGGAATVIIQGLGLGMLSCLPPTLVIIVTIVACDTLASAYGIAIAAVGMLSTLGVTLATDAYGPVADNAGGIAEMAELPDRVRQITDDLDALGNTTAATGKGFAIGSAVLTALSLLASFKTAAGVQVTDVTNPIVLAGLLLGAVLPFVFSALTMLSVRKAATSIILEVRKQFQENPQLKVEGSGAVPDYKECIRISTKASVEEMILPGGLAILAPCWIGIMVGPSCLAGMLSGAIGAGFMMAVMMSNTGGAWDNSKKYIEIAGAHGGKHSEAHKAAVVGDTVGDPFKDTSGPALNILIKLMSMVSLVIAPLLDQEDWGTYEYGFIPLVLILLLSYVCYVKFWSTFESEANAKMRQFDARAIEMAKTASKDAAPVAAENVTAHVQGEI
jgi:K(+)-stimulated pyrophosphate-energized sodium pump